VTGPTLPRRWLPEAATDGLAAVLFAGFVGCLLLGYFDSRFPYATLATLPLVGSLAMLSWGNLKADRVARSLPSTSGP
jgi:hypothetical protein